MSPPRTRLDPEGYYARLGLEPAADRAAVVAAYRAKARRFHPDVPVTGNAAAFVAVKQAYDVLSDQDRRGAYDRLARQAAIQPEVIVARSAAYPEAAPSRHPRFSDLPVMVWVGLAAFLVLCVYQATAHLLAPSNVIRAEIRPNAATVAPLSPSAHQAVLYGPTPLRLAGTPNFYVVPAGSPAVLWRMDPAHDNALTPLGQLPPFSAVQAVRLNRQNGMLEVLLNDNASGFISPDHLTAGNAVAAYRAYCGHNAGPAPFDGEVLEQRGIGAGTLVLQNRAVQPVVVKLRDGAGALVVSVFLGPGGHAKLDGLPEGVYRPDFAIGELWSRACNVFAAGMRARRMEAAIRVPGVSPLVVAPDGGVPAALDISDQAFGKN
jgi:hypothetical protein